MKIGFVLPSHNYNIVLTKDELNMLLSGKVISMRPERTTGYHFDSVGKGTPIQGHHLAVESDGAEQETIQYLTIVVDDLI